MKKFFTKNQNIFKIKINNLLLLLIITLLIFFSTQKDLLGIASLFAILFVTIFFTKKFQSLSSILYVAFLLRLITIILGDTVITLPDSWGDAEVFEDKAWKLSQGNLSDVLKNYQNIEKSFFISWILAIFYNLFDRSMLLGQSISLFFGISTILLAFKISCRIWDEKVSIKLGWLLALYPTFILYSCLILRESYVWFFLLISLYGIVCWVNDKSYKSLIITFFGFYLATLFHGGMFIGGLFFLIIIIFTSIKDIINNIGKLRIPKKSSIFFFTSLLLLIYILIFADNIPKIKSVTQLINIDRLLIEISNRNINNAGYPEWTIPKTLLELIYKAPIRIFYFLFSPFPWDLSKITHLIGLLDGTFFCLLFILIIKNFNSIWDDKALRFIFLIFLSYLLIFGISTGNFGTGIRHRSKFIPILILMVLPWIPKFTLKKNKYSRIKIN